jgi:hypothetical protein
LILGFHALAANFFDHSIFAEDLGFWMDLDLILSGRARES